MPALHRTAYPAALILLALTAQAGMAQVDHGMALPIGSVDQLAKLPWPELERIYRGASPGTLPNGFARGRVVYPPETPLGGIKAQATGCWWRGKIFCATDGTLVNQWLGVRAIRARTGYGPSWLDGQPALILDYAETSHWWRDVRDEMREVAPGIYLGAMYVRHCPAPQLKMFFLLEAAPPCGR